MWKIRSLAVAAAALAMAAAGAAEAKPLMPKTVGASAGQESLVETGHRHPHGWSHWRGYNHYRRHRGFSLRLGWGYPSYGRPWADPPPVQYYAARPRAIAPLPAPVIRYGAAPAGAAQ